MKKLIFGVVAILIIVIVGAIVILSQSGEIIRAGVEEYGPTVTGGEVTLQKADVSIFGGSLSLKNLVIGNPSGFETPNAFTLGAVQVDMDMASLGSDVIHIENILIDAPEITYELVGRRSNIDALQRNIERNIGTSSETDSAEEPVNLIIDNLLIRNAKLSVVLEIGEGSITEVTLPEIRVTNIGRTGDPVDPAEAATIVMSSLVASIAEVVATEQIQKLLNFGTDGIVDQIGERLRGLFGND